MENNTVFQNEYVVSNDRININKRLGLYGLLGMLQETAGDHAESLGFGYDQMKERGFFWVLIQQKLKMEEWPVWRDTITIKTWTLGVKGFKAVREFEIFRGDQKLGECATNWMTLDAETRRPKTIDAEDYSFYVREDYSLNFQAAKVKLPEQLSTSNEIRVRVSDLDMNLHVNNVKYTQWLLDSIPLKAHQNYLIKEYEINFIAETFLNDTVLCKSNLREISDTGDQVEIFFNGVKEENDKSVFISRLVAHRI